jgi:DNA-binding transcriptional MocR family regulator
MATVTRRAPHLGVVYDIPPGCEALRVQIARRSMNAGCTLTPDDLVLTCGCQEALNLCLRAVAKPGDTILLESPTYYGVLQIIESLGMCALELPTHPRQGINLDALEYALEQQEVKACLLSPNFNNPLGSCMPEANKERLVKILEQHNIPLIEDDIYGDISFAAPRPKGGQSIRPYWKRADVFVIFQDARARLSHRMGRAGTLSKADRVLESDEHTGGRFAAFANRRRVSGQRQLRPSPATHHALVSRPRAVRAARYRAIFPGRHTRHASCRWLRGVGATYQMA